MTNAARKVLAALIAKRPGDMEPVALVVQTGLAINTVRAACNELRRAGVVGFREVKSGFMDVHPTKHWYAMPNAALGGPVGARGRPACPPALGQAVTAVLEARRALSMREVREACGLSETHAAKQLKAALAAGVVTRVRGDLPPVGSVRPWLWRAA